MANQGYANIYNWYSSPMTNADGWTHGPKIWFCQGGIKPQDDNFIRSVVI